MDPLTSQKLGDEYWYHVDLDDFDNITLVKHFRTISKDSDKPMYKKGVIVEIKI